MRLIPKVKPLFFSALLTSSPLELYNREVKEGLLRFDQTQFDILTTLEPIFLSILQSKYTSHLPLRAFSLLRSRYTKPNHGVYIYGDVGRGKTIIMSLFYEALPQGFKKKIHFHEFMQSVHDQLQQIRQDQKLHTDAPILLMARKIAQSCKYLFLDELQIKDIADAMIISRLFSCLFDQGVFVFFTSNRPPQDLYSNGLHRDRFEPFIDLIQAKLKIISLDSPLDYRRERLNERPLYYFPLNTHSENAIKSIFEVLTDQEPPKPFTMKVHSRLEILKRSAKGVLWISFDELCGKPFGAADYIQLTHHFHTILLEGVPKLQSDQFNEAKRFITLIDIIYEHQIKLVISAEVDIDNLYEKGEGAFEFKRTASRLDEMRNWGS